MEKQLQNQSSNPKIMPSFKIKKGNKYKCKDWSSFAYHDEFIPGRTYEALEDNELAGEVHKYGFSIRGVENFEDKFELVNAGEMDMKYTDLVKGEIYFCNINELFCIFMFNGTAEGTERAGYSHALVDMDSPGRPVYKTNGVVFWPGRNLRPATEKEKAWLSICVEKQHFINKSEATLLSEIPSDIRGILTKFYPVGTRFKCVNGNTCGSADAIYTVERRMDGQPDYKTHAEWTNVHAGSGWIYLNGKWADIINPDGRKVPINTINSLTEDYPIF